MKVSVVGLHGGGFGISIRTVSRPAQTSTVSQEPAVVVVTFNSERHVRACLRAVRGMDVTVVDNASTDATREVVRREFPDVELIPLARNVGLSTAFNVACKQLDGRDVLFLNPDVTADRSGVLRLSNLLARRPDAAIVGPRLLNGDGSEQASARSFPTFSNALARRTIWRRTPWGRRTLDRHLATPYGVDTEAVAVDWLLGAAMLIRAEALQALGGFDSRYFLYCEDTDFCARAWRNGYTVLYCSDVVFTHEYQRASRRTLDLTSRATRAHWRSTLRLATSYPRQYFGRPLQRGTDSEGDRAPMRRSIDSRSGASAGR